MTPLPELHSLIGGEISQRRWVGRVLALVQHYDEDKRSARGLVGSVDDHSNFDHCDLGTTSERQRSGRWLSDVKVTALGFFLKHPKYNN